MKHYLSLKLFILICCFIVPFLFSTVMMMDASPKFKKISELLKISNEANHLKEQFLANDNANDEVNLVKMFQISVEIPSLEKMFDDQKMEQIFMCTENKESEEGPLIKTKMDEYEVFINQFFADNPSRCTADDDDDDEPRIFHEQFLDKNLAATAEPMTAQNEKIVPKNDGNLKIQKNNSEIFTSAKSAEKSSAEKKRKIQLTIDVNEKNGENKIDELNFENLKLKSPKIVAENWPKNGENLAKQKNIAENQPKIVAENRSITTQLFNNNLYKISQILASFKARHGQRWAIINKFLARIMTTEDNNKMPKFGEFLQKNSKNLADEEKSDEIFTEFDQDVHKQKQHEMYKNHVVSVWHFIDTAILCAEIALLPISAISALAADRHLFELVDMDKAVCALISSDQVIVNLKIYISWATNRLAEDAIFDNVTSYSLMTTMKKVISNACTSGKKCYKGENKILLNLRVYFCVFGAIKRQISTQIIEDTVVEIGNNGTVWEEWHKLHNFVHEFVGKLVQFVETAAEVGIEHARRRQCKN